MKHHPFARLSLSASLAFLFTATALAQSDTSSLSGTVTDPSSSVVANAKITVHNNATGTDRSINTNENGSFTLTNLPSGNYTIRIEAQGFQTTTRSNVHLDPNIGSRIDMAMKVGDTNTVVNVESDANAVQTESASVGQLVTEEQVKSIQLNGRNPFYLSQLEPGVMRNSAMSSFNFSLDNTVYINGSRSEENLMTLDGAPMVRTRSNNDSTGVADVDATSQVQILTTSYPAEYGRTSGGQIASCPRVVRVHFTEAPLSTCAIQC